MGRPPQIRAEEKTRIVLAVLAGELSIAEAARKEKMSEQSIGRWKADFIEAARPHSRQAAPVRRRAKRSSRPRSRN